MIPSSLHDEYFCLTSTDDISTKDIANKSEHLNLLLSHPSLYPNVTFTDDISIPINVVEDNGIFDASLPTAIFRQTNSSDLEQTENILQSTNIMCINCSRVFLSLEEFQKHSCDFLEEADINNKPKREKDFEKPGETPENVDKQNENNDKDGEDEVQGALECFICNKILPNEISLNRHVVRHSSKSNFECTICNKKIKGKNMYVKHLAAHANSKGGRLSRTCNYCYKEFKKPSDLERHLERTREKDHLAVIYAIKSSL
ncbi:hypothetical protein NQ317_007433 [Molorchus minor]|uniref:C2H2-type domain-containing protein n=1 Tax=Molorchus minor TaxID=1323400 RepID=A0ABQ9JH98_9CUCU|nr:hypothetical protein NQ317_007433 [Molorchus minor]